jgi:hypothetical protein
VIPVAPGALAALAVPDGTSGRCGCVLLCCDLGPAAWPSAPRALRSATGREGWARMVEGIDRLGWRGACSATIAVAWRVACLATTFDARGRAGALGARNMAA